jgi:hypothetical protein
MPTSPDIIGVISAAKSSFAKPSFHWHSYCGRLVYLETKEQEDL